MIDISPGMVERSRRKSHTYEGALDARVMDVQALGLPVVARAGLAFMDAIGNALDLSNLRARHFKPALEAAKIERPVRIYDSATDSRRRRSRPGRT